MKGRHQPTCLVEFHGIFLLPIGAALVFLLVLSCRSHAPASLSPDRVIEVWYGDEQSFGMKGNPQRWMNILGSVRSPGSARSTWYSLNGTGNHPFSLGKNMTRLAGEGDFNIEIDRHSLKAGKNKLVIAVEDTSGKVFIKSIIINYFSDKEWPLPYHVDWTKERDISGAVQVVDGKWKLTPEGIRTVEPYYDRMVAFGDSSWVNYEVRVEVKFHGYASPVPEPPVYGVCHAAIALRWPGHDEDHHQPHVKWYPLGATCEFKLFDHPDTCRFRIIGDHHMYNENAQVRHRVETGVWYVMKARVKSEGDSTLYCARFWKRSDPEPSEWDIVSREGSSDLKCGSALLIAHHSDVTFGNIDCISLESAKLNERIRTEVIKTEAQSLELYKWLHQNPELSGMEMETSSRMASELRELGIEVTEGVGGYGVVGVLRNGAGPVLMLRTDMDALPILEETGVEFASRKVMKNEQGEELPVMHACGHDMHMTVWLGTLRVLATLRNTWKGTILAVAQPAEETGKGARAMIEDGLFKRFPVPDMALCYHVSASLPAGVIGYIPGPAYAGSTSADITIYGVGGHGATPHKTIDPVVIAAETIMGIQTIVSRTINPLEPAVITVGSIHGGTKNNIIPDKVNLQLTIRYFSEEVRQQILKSLVTLTKGIALSSGLPADKMPEIVFGENQTPPLYNDPSLVARTVAAMATILGKESLIHLTSPTTASEDFARYGKTEEEIPVSIFWLGTVSKEATEKRSREGKLLPMLHNAGYYPDFSLSYQTGVSAMTKSCIELLNSHEP